MPVLLKDYRCNDFSKRVTVYSKLKRITTRGFDTSNDFFAGGNFGILQGLNDNSKNYFSLRCNDIIEFKGIYVACGQHASTDPRKELSTFLYSVDKGVSWTFANDTFGGGGKGQVLIVSDNILFCGGKGSDDDGTTYYGLMKSTNGKTWTKVTSPFSEITSMATVGSGEIVAVGMDTTNTNQIVRYSINNGSPWDLDPAISITKDDTVTTFHANDRFYIGVSQINSSLTVYTSLTALTSWSTVPLTDINSTPITFAAHLNGVYYSSGQYILYLGTVGLNNIPPVFYSSTGDNFTACRDINISDVDVKNVAYNVADSRFYLSVSYSNFPLSSGTPIMYTSSDGESWGKIIDNNHLFSVLPSSLNSDGVTGISQFFIVEDLIVAVGSYKNINSFGLVPISSIVHAVTNVIRPIVLNGGVTKLLYDEDSLMIGVFENTTSDNTIYYYDETQLKLAVTEHHGDV